MFKDVANNVRGHTKKLSYIYYQAKYVVKCIFFCFIFISMQIIFADAFFIPNAYQ